jgi:hypothetical protein
MRYLGQFAKPSGIVYPDFGEEVMVEPFDIPADWPVFVALDPGVFFGALFWAWNDGTFYSFAEYYTETVRPAVEHAAELRARVRGQVQGWIYDPARITDVTDLQQHGVGPLYRADNAVLAGIASLTALIKTGHFKIMRGRCPNFVDQMEKYAFPTDPLSGTIANENPIKKDDHLPDCARYLAHTLTGAKIDEGAKVVMVDDWQPISPY